MTNSAWILALLIALPSLGAEESKSDLKPNILLITADNLGYGDLPCYNAASPIKTPNLDRLAAQGARLTSFYTASPTCTVSRACLLTGRIPQRHGLTDQLPGLAGNYGVGLNQDEILIPQVLKNAPTPYATGCFGKWNIGFAEGSRPTERGFDEFLGHASGNIDYYHHIYNGRHDLFRGTEEFAAYGMSPDEMDPRRRYDAVVTALDEAIGRVLDAVDHAGMAQQTFVFFYSDNGAFRLGRQGLDVGVNDPLRHGGVTCWEGGLRVAAMARWPGKIAAGSVISQPLWSPDLMISCAELAQAPLPDDRVFDGKNPFHVLTAGDDSPHKSFFFAYRTHAALRQGDWKIVREKPNDPWQLFDLAMDLGEKHNLAGDHPERVAELGQTFIAWQDSF